MLVLKNVNRRIKISDFIKLAFQRLLISNQAIGSDDSIYLSANLGILFQGNEHFVSCCPPLPVANFMPSTILFGQKALGHTGIADRNFLLKF